MSIRILEYNRHAYLPVPFVCVEIVPGKAEVLYPKARRKQVIDIAKGDHNGRRELPPEEWDDRLCVMLAKRALLGK